jgi:hypothetical protein
MKNMFAALAMLALLAAPALAGDITIGKKSTSEWYGCLEQDPVLAVLKTIEEKGDNASLADWSKAMATGRCVEPRGPMAVMVVRVIKQAKNFAKGTGAAVGHVYSVVEIKDARDQTWYCITSETIIPAKPVEGTI